MILKQATILYKDYDPEDLSKGSNKRICCSCDRCGRVRWSEFKNYKSLCNSCKQIGKLNHKYGKHIDSENHNWYGKHHSDETKKIMSNAQWGKRGNNYGKHHSLKTKNKIRKNMPDRSGYLNPSWKGGIAHIRDHVLPFNQCLKINKYFKGSHGHHISSDIVVYIPEKLHRHISHNLKTGKGMSEMNLLSLQYIRGWL